jgi:hypothetical protein
MISGNPFTPTVTADVIILEMRGDTSSVRCVTAPLGERTFPLGVETLVQQSLRHEPPQPIELEHAIELTEEAVMPLAAQFAGRPGLVLQDLGASLIARGLAASGIKQTALTLDQVEALFSRLVSVSQGRPASQESLPTNARFFAIGAKPSDFTDGKGPVFVLIATA